MFLGLDGCLQMYDFLSKFVDKDEARKMICYHSWRDEIVLLAQDGEIIAAAFFVQVDDPNDVNGVIPPAAQENSTGKYVYISAIFVDRDFRGRLDHIRALFRGAMARCPASERIAFRRGRVFEKVRRKKKFGNRHPDRVHVIRPRFDDGKRANDDADSGRPVSQ